MPVLVLATIFGFTSAINVVHAQSPTFTQYVCFHCPTVSQSTYGVEKWKFGATNNDPVNSIFVAFAISAVSSGGDSLFAMSNVMQVLPNHALNNIVMTLTLTQALIGQTFAFTVT